MAPYVSYAEVENELPNTVRPQKTAIEGYIAEAERRAKHKVGDPLPPNHDLLRTAIRDYAVAKALEKEYRTTSRELFTSARQLRQDSLDLMDEVDVEDTSEADATPDENTAYVRRVRF